MSAIAEAIASEQNTRIAEQNVSSGDFKLWLTAGEFQVSQVASTYRILPHDTGTFLSSFTNDLSRLSRAGRETLENVRSNRTADSVHPAWSAIQLYYAAFYYASALLRMVGVTSAYFLLSDLIEVRKKLQLQAVTPLPGKGIYTLSVTPSAVWFEIEKDSESGSHEALWKLYRDYLFGLKSRLPNYGQFDQTFILTAISEIDVVIDCSTGLPADYNLSSTRNLIQYRQGLSCWYPMT